MEFKVGDVVEITNSLTPSLIDGDFLTLTRLDEDGDWWGRREAAVGSYLLGKNSSGDRVTFKKHNKAETKPKHENKEDDLRGEILDLMAQLSDANLKAIRYESAFRELFAYVEGFYITSQAHPVPVFANSLKKRLEG